MAGVDASSVALVLACSTGCASAGFPRPLGKKPTSKVLSVRGGGLEELASLDWRYFAAGGICAAFSHGITTPIDVVKTCMQTHPEKYSKGVVQAARDIVKQEGVGYLLAGLGPTVVGYGFEGALKFGFYETFKVIFAGVTQNKFVNFLMASVIAGAIASVVLCPMEEARIKMVNDPTWAQENVISSIVRLIREDGVFSSFSGLPAMLSKQIPYTMGKQVSFDLIAQLLYVLAAYLAVSAADAKWAISLGAAFLASIVACLTSQPGDMILTATYKGAGHSGHGDHSGPSVRESAQKVHETHVAPAIQPGVVLWEDAVAPSSVSDNVSDVSSDVSVNPSTPTHMPLDKPSVTQATTAASSKQFSTVVSSIYRQHGLGGFYLGLGARLAHVASIITSQLVVYDLIKMALGLPVTGSH
eukprot:gene15584-17812_t